MESLIYFCRSTSIQKLIESFRSDKLEINFFCVFKVSIISLDNNIYTQHVCVWMEKLIFILET